MSTQYSYFRSIPFRRAYCLKLFFGIAILFIVLGCVSLTRVFASSTLTNAGAVSVTVSSSSWLTVSAPFTEDANHNGYTKFEVGTSSGGPFDTNGMAYPYLAGDSSWRIGHHYNATAGTSYYYRVTYIDPDGVTGSSVQIVGPYTAQSSASNASTIGTVTATPSDTEILVVLPLQGDVNQNSSGTVELGTSASGPWTTKCGALPVVPHQCRVRSLTPNTDYWIRATTTDTDGVGGTNPQVLGPIHYSGVANLALGKAITADTGYSCCTSSSQLVDGIITYSSWPFGYAWAGGTNCFGGPCAGFKNATIDFGSATTFNRAMVWYHDPNNVPMTWKFQYSNDNSNWTDAYSTTLAFCRTNTIQMPGQWAITACGHDATFSSITARYFRYTFDDGTLFGGIHGWAVEIEVFNTFDPVVHNTNNSGTGSLRDVVTNAPAGTTITFDPAVFNTPQTITLTSGVIPITQNLTIQGAGSNLVTIDGNNTSRVFTVASGITATISGVTIQHGNAGASPNQGGGIYSQGNLTILNSIITANSAEAGAGVFSDVAPSALTIRDSTFANNNTTGTGGAGSGGALINLGTLTVTGSTFNNNQVADYGGAIYNGGASSSATIANSTFYANRVNSTGAGGAIRNDGILNMSNTTIVNNFSGFTGSFLYQTGTSNATVRNTIVAGNTASACYLQGGSYTGTTSNLADNNSCTGATQVTLAQLQLGSLANNGGSTQTIALLSGSVAIGAGNQSVCTTSPVNSVDQRGVARKNPCDVGAYETTSNPTATATSTNTTTNTATATNTASLTSTITPSHTPTVTPTATATSTIMPTNTATRTPTPTPSITPVPVSPDTIGIYRTSNNTFYLRNSNTFGFADIVIQYGYPNTYPVVGDWNNDGVDTIGIYDQSAGVFLLRNANVPGSPDITLTMGNPSDQPIAGHWTSDMNGDGVGVFRPSNGILYLKKTLTTGFADYFAVMGNPSDIGVAGDWTGDGFDSPGVYRPGLSHFYLSNNSQPTGITFSDLDLTLGNPCTGGNPYTSCDLPVAGDWVAQGHAGVGVFRATNGQIYFRNTLSTGFSDNNFVYGNAGDIPIAGKWVSGSKPPLSGLLNSSGYSDDNDTSGSD